MAAIGRFPGVFKMILNTVQFFHLTLEVLADGQRAGKIIRQELRTISDDVAMFFLSTICCVGYRPVCGVSRRHCVGTFAKTTLRLGCCALRVAAA